MNTFMNSKPTARLSTSAALLFAGLFGASTLAAQETSNRTEMPRPSRDVSSCQKVDWNQDLLADYPWAIGSCQEVILVDGQEWARFEAEFEGMNRDGTFDVDFLNRRGRSQAVISLKPAPGQMVLLDNREYAFSELADNQKLNFYVPEGIYGFAVAPGVAPDEIAEVVQPRTPAAEPERLARAEPRPARRSNTLPATAGPLPLFALGGFFAMLGGFGMTMRRRSSGSSE